MKKSYTLIIIVIVILCGKVNASDYYWVGGSGYWSGFATHWATKSGGNIFYTNAPSDTDNVFFDSKSFTAEEQKVIIDLNPTTCMNMNWSGVTHTPELAGAVQNNLNIYGSLTFVSGMKFTFWGPLNFLGTATNLTITTAGKVFNQPMNLGITFNGVGAVWTLKDDLAMYSLSSGGNISLTNGTLTANNQTVSCRNFVGGAGTTLNMVSSTFNVYQQWTVNATQTLNASLSTLNIGGSSNTFNSNGKTYWDVNLTNSSQSIGQSNMSNTFNNVTFHAVQSNSQIKGNNIFHDVIFLATIGTAEFQNGIIGNTFNNLTFYGDATISNNNTINGTLTLSPAHTYTLANGKTQTFTNLMADGRCGVPIVINSSMAGSQSTIIKSGTGTVTVSYVTFQDINAALVSGVIYTANNSTDVSGNSTNWVFTDPPTTTDLYWVGGTGNWSDGSHWSLTSGGSPFGCVPSSITNVFFDAKSFSVTGQEVSVDIASANCKNMIWTTGVNVYAPKFSCSKTLNIYGSLLLASGMNLNFSGAMNFLGTSTNLSVTFAGHIFSQPMNVSIAFNGNGGQWTLQDDLTTTNGVLSLNNGTLNTNNKTVTARDFYSQSSATRELNMGSSIFNFQYGWNISGGNFTFNSGTSILNLSASSSFFGGGKVYNNVNFTDIYGYGFIRDGNNIFNDVNFYGQATTSGNNTFHDVVFNNIEEGANIQGNNTFNSALFKGGGSISGTNTFNDITFSPGHTYNFQSGKTQTIINTLNLKGKADSLITIQSSNAGSPFTISKSSGIVCADYISMMNSSAIGGAAFNAGPSSIDMNGNTGWNFLSSNTPTVSISSFPSSTICAGTSVTFTATPVSGGVPVYKWKLNGNEAGTNSSNYSSNTLLNGDQVKVVMEEATTNSGCMFTLTAISNIITVSVDNPVPLAIAGTNVTGTQILANWNTVSGVTAYFLDVSTDMNFNSFVSGYNNLNVGNVTTYPVTGLMNNTIYYYRVRGANATCTSYNSNTISIRTSPSVAISEIVEKDIKLQIYPNPVNNTIFINDLNDNDIESIEIYDVMGRLLTSEYPKHNSRYTIDVTGISEGVYYLKIKIVGKNSEMYKVVKI